MSTIKELQSRRDHWYNKACAAALDMSKSVDELRQYQAFGWVVTAQIDRLAGCDWRQDIDHALSVAPDDLLRLRNDRHVQDDAPNVESKNPTRVSNSRDSALKRATDNLTTDAGSLEIANYIRAQYP